MPENTNHTVQSSPAQIVRVDPAVVENAMRAWADRFLDAANAASRAPKRDRTMIMREHRDRDNENDVFTHALGRPIERACDEALVQARAYTGRGREYDHLATDVLHCRGCQCTGLIEVDLDAVRDRLGAWVEGHLAWRRSVALAWRRSLALGTRIPADPVTPFHQALLEVLDERLREIWDEHVTRTLAAIYDRF